MNKKEIAEIRKLLTKDKCRLDRICGCYIDGHKEKKMEMREAFLSLPEEEMFKYLDIFKKALSGTLGKNLFNLDFPLEEEMSDGHQKSLLLLRDSELKDDAMLEAFYEKFLTTYLYPENYLILLAHGSYDIPARGSDRLEMEDASEYVYHFILCCVCPVNLSKPGLCYDADNNTFVDKLQDWMVQMPDLAFLFPAFNDRNTDLHTTLYYSRNADLLHPEIPEGILGCPLPSPAKEQQLTFNAMVEETFGGECDFEVARTIHENLQTLLKEKKDEPEPLTLDKQDVHRILEDCGAKPEQLEHFEEEYDQQAGQETNLLADNLTNSRTFEVKTPDITIRVNPDRTDLLETQVIQGQECLVIPLTDEVEVNGIRVRSTPGGKEFDNP